MIATYKASEEFDKNEKKRGEAHTAMNNALYDENGNRKQTATPSPTAVAAGGGQSGGGISRKRIHPQYITQVTENRNKIFKKELEIINSIRRFHRSHTIRKRDKINSILGLRKSRNNKNDANRKNTRRRLVQDRHNNYKHRTTKYVEK
jgi:hypothetical protein